MLRTKAGVKSHDATLVNPARNKLDSFVLDGEFLLGAANSFVTPAFGYTAGT